VKSLTSRADVDALRRRLLTVRADSVRRWGQMSAHQMICHLRDAFLMGTPAGVPVSDVSHVVNRTIAKWVAIYAPARWPRGIMTRPEIDQVRGGGTAPAQFAEDVAALVALLDVITTDPQFFDGRRHPIFGPLSRTAWLRWGYLHVDHHLRQFGA
jgi:hypothetical protein